MLIKTGTLPLVIIMPVTVLTTVDLYQFQAQHLEITPLHLSPCLSQKPVKSVCHITVTQFTTCLVLLLVLGQHCEFWLAVQSFRNKYAKAKNEVKAEKVRIDLAVFLFFPYCRNRVDDDGIVIANRFLLVFVIQICHAFFSFRRVRCSRPSIVKQSE